MIDVRNHSEVRELRLARPPVNALNPELIEALRREVLAAPEAGAEALVISAEGKVFSGGLDLPVLVELDREAIRATWISFYGLIEALAKSPIPTVAAIPGHSPAGGAVISMFCDARIMAETPSEVSDSGRRKSFKIGLNEVAVGLPLPLTIFFRLRQLVSSRQAERLAVGGLLIDSEEAHRIGLVDQLCPADDVVDQALAWCRSLLALPRHSMLQTRSEARAEIGDLFKDAVEDEIDALLDTWFSDEVHGALRAVVAQLTGTKN